MILTNRQVHPSHTGPFLEKSKWNSNQNMIVFLLENAMINKRNDALVLLVKNSQARMSAYGSHRVNSKHLIDVICVINLVHP